MWTDLQNLCMDTKVNFKFCYLAAISEVPTIESRPMNCSLWVLQELPAAGFRRHSQGNQDGIIRDVFRHVGTTNRNAVEFGFDYVGKAKVNGRKGEQPINMSSDGFHLNTRLLRVEGWRVTYFDSLIEDAAEGIRKVTLTEENIDGAFRAAHVPTEVDYVSIDVDSVDVWLLRGMLKHYRPRVISVEYNRNFLFWMKVTHVREWHPWTVRSVYGASAGAINHVATEKGYTPIHIMPNGMDMFLVRTDLLQALCTGGPRSIPSFEALAIDAGVGKRIHRSCDPRLDLPRLVDLELELKGYHSHALFKASADVATLNRLNPGDPMCNKTAITSRAPVEPRPHVLFPVRSISVWPGRGAGGIRLGLTLVLYVGLDNHIHAL